jgi:hypothetical protein
MFWKYIKKVTRSNNKPQVIPSGNRNDMILKKKELPIKSAVSGKSVVAKKRPEKNKKKPLVVAQEEKSFWVNNGGALRTLKDLQEAFSHMSDEQFKYHTKRNGNDFSKWVFHVLQDPKCATDIEKAKTKNAAADAVLKHLKNYS